MGSVRAFELVVGFVESFKFGLSKWVLCFFFVSFAALSADGCVGIVTSH